MVQYERNFNEFPEFTMTQTFFFYLTKYYFVIYLVKIFFSKIDFFFHIFHVFQVTFLNVHLIITLLRLRDNRQVLDAC